MRSRLICCKIQGWLGGLFLVASMAFVFMTLTFGSAFADPVQQPVAAVSTSAGAQRSPRAPARSGASQRSGAIRPDATGIRSAAGAAIVPAQNQNQQPRAANTARSATTARTVAARTNPAAAKTAATARSVRSRGRTTTTASSRTVRARTGIQPTQARVSLSGSALRASTTSSLSTSGLTSKLSSTIYSSLVDPNTGLISADAYSNCVESYYTCMDEICGARVPGQRRCACAGRVKTFNNVEATLQTAKEDLLKVSGELNLLILSKGETISTAFQLTDAEKSLNCVSFRDAVRKGDAIDGAGGWCSKHNGGVSTGTEGFLDDSPLVNCKAQMNEMCKTMYSAISDDDWMNILNGADSDIMTSLTTYANTINEVDTFSTGSDDNLISSIDTVWNVVDGTTGTLFSDQTSVDKLAQTWGYDLYAYAHNNVCGRVLDACFNGIYEACGARPAAQGGGTGPYNLNSDITVGSDGDIAFSLPSGSSSGTAACFGYANSSGDPYSELRRPVADARVSVLQKYVLDANADCDVYGDELKKQAQNMAYQKIAATQLLQKKRLEFATEKSANIAAELASAKQNYLKCVDEILACRRDRGQAANQTTATVKNFCNQMTNVPSCYEQMVCDQEATEVIIADVAANASTGTPAKNQNTVYLSDITAASNPASARATCMADNTLGIGNIRTDEYCTDARVWIEAGGTCPVVTTP